MNNNGKSSVSNLCSWFLSHRLTRSKAIAVGLSAIFFIIFTGHSMVPINDIYSECKKPDYPTLSVDKYKDAGKICMASLTDAKLGSPLQRIVRWLNSDSLLEMTWPNKQAYADKHGYSFFDESDNLDKLRPPSWSKIKAAQRLLHEEDCDWVFWLDADTVIINSEKTVQAFLPSNPDKDLILTRQKGGNYNAGAWLIRNSAWSKQFLQHWWDMKESVQPTGLRTSGDNAALKAYLLDQMDPAEFKKHIVLSRPDSHIIPSRYSCRPLNQRFW
jgi:mannan polymerase II complex MNN10 subunit